MDKLIGKPFKEIVSAAGIESDGATGLLMAA